PAQRAGGPLPRRGGAGAAAGRSLGNVSAQRRAAASHRARRASAARRRAADWPGGLRRPRPRAVRLPRADLDAALRRSGGAGDRPRPSLARGGAARRWGGAGGSAEERISRRAGARAAQSAGADRQLAARLARRRGAVAQSLAGAVDGGSTGASPGAL